LSGGRPLQGALYHLMPRDMASPAACVLRLAATLGLVGLGGLLWRQLAAWTPASLPRLLLVCAVLALPTFQVAVGWLACWPSTLAALMAGCAAYLMLGPVGNTSSVANNVSLPLSLSLSPSLPLNRPMRKSAPRVALAAVLNMAALCVYQPAAMWYWTVVLVALLSSNMAEPSARRRLASAVWAGGLHLVLYFCLVKGLQAYCDVTPVARGALATDIVGKLSWFVAKPLRNSLNAWNLFKPRWFGGVALAVIAAAGWLAIREARSRQGNRWLILHAALIAGCVVLSYLPNLIVVESWASCRSTIALSGSVTLVGLAAGRTLCRRVAWSPGWLLSARLSAVAVCLLLLAVARWNVVETIIVPQQRERAQILAGLDAGLHDGIRRVHLVQPDPHQYSPRSEHDEFGLATTATNFGARALLELALQERVPQRALEISLGRAPHDTTDPAVLNLDLRAGDARQ
jgi:hypothetical protein